MYTNNRVLPDDISKQSLCIPLKLSIVLIVDSFCDVNIEYEKIFQDWFPIGNAL